MFYVASKKVPLPLDRGGAKEADIGVNDWSIKLIINPKTNGRMSFFDSYAFAKRADEPTSSQSAPRGNGKV
jgi:hypothetical protein